MDLIDKNMAIDICNSAIDLWHGQLGEGALVAVKEGIEGLPPAEPERKGKWIEYTDCEGKSRRITCDQCGHEEWNWCNPKFCPNCGSYNGGDAE